MKNQRYKLLLVILLLTCILFLASALRLYKLGNIPYGALIDEAHFGYIAESLLQTGKDEHGVPWPLIFKGFGDHKLPLYAYGLLPFIQAFGLSVFSIRILSALAGIAVVGMSYPLLRRLKIPQGSSLLTVLIAAVLPWTFFLSRFGFESNLTLAVWMAGLLAFATYFYSKSKHTIMYAYVGTFLMALTWYGYIAYRPVSLVIFFIMITVVVYLKKLQKKQAFLLTAVFFLFISPLFFANNGTNSNTARLKQTSMFSDGGIIRSIDESRNYCQEDLPRLACDLLWNKATASIFVLGSRVAMVASPHYMAYTGEADTYLSTDKVGLVYVSVFILIVISLFFLVRDYSRLRKIGLVSLLFLLIALLPAIISGEPQRVRMSPAIPFLLILIGVGLTTIEEMLKKHAKSFWLYFTLIMIIVAVMVESTAYFIDFFTVHTKKYDLSYLSHVRDMMPFLSDTAKGNPIFMKTLFSDPVMYYAFYSKLDPKIYQQTAQLGLLEDSGFQHTNSVANFFLTEETPNTLGCNALRTGIDGLYVTNQPEDSFPIPIKIFYSQNGSLKYAYVYSLIDLGKWFSASCPKE